MWEAIRWLGALGEPAAVCETGLPAGWALAGAGNPVPTEPLALVDAQRANIVLRRAPSGLRLRGEAVDVAWARVAEHIVLLAEFEGQPLVAIVPRSSTTTTPRSNLAGEPRDRVEFIDVELSDGQVAAASVDATSSSLQMRGALGRASLMAGAIEATAEIALAHARDREQFGRTIARFQAVQHHLVILAEEAACAGLAARYAAASADTNTDLAGVEIAAGKAVVGRAARVAAARSHQVLGAIGTTHEHPLQLLTIER